MSGPYLRLYGLKPVGDKHRKMWGVYKACKEAGIEVPDEVLCYFGDAEPDECGVLLELTKDPAVRSKDLSPGCLLEVRLDLLDKDITTLRFIEEE